MVNQYTKLTAGIEAKSDRNVIVKMKGTFTERPKKPKWVIPAADEEAKSLKEMQLIPNRHDIVFIHTPIYTYIYIYIVYSPYICNIFILTADLIWTWI